MKITQLSVNSIKLVHEITMHELDKIISGYTFENSAIFTKNGNSVVMTWYNHQISVNPSSLFLFYQEAHRYWNIPCPQALAGGRKKFAGFLLGDIPKHSKLLIEADAEIYEDWNAEDLYLILGDNLESVKWDRFVSCWNRAKIFTVEGFLNFLNEDVQYNNKDATVNFLLKKCEYFAEGYFKWPHTDFYPSKRVLEGIDSPHIGLLQHMGYRVGKRGLASFDRRQILRKVFSERLPFVDSVEYMKEWCGANTPFRLQKQANTLAGFARNAMRRDGDYDGAIQDWVEDLAWLKKEYYDKMNFGFWWPKVGE